MQKPEILKAEKSIRKRVKKQVEKYSDPNHKSFDEEIDEKFGKIDDFSDYRKERENKKVETAWDYEPSFFMEDGEVSVLYRDTFKKPKEIPLNEAELVTPEKILREEAEKNMQKKLI
jgi:hypothetical protein